MASVVLLAVVGIVVYTVKKCRASTQAGHQPAAARSYDTGGPPPEYAAAVDHDGVPTANLRRDPATVSANTHVPNYYVVNGGEIPVPTEDPPPVPVSPTARMTDDTYTGLRKDSIYVRPVEDDYCTICDIPSDSRRVSSGSGSRKDLSTPASLARQHSAPAESPPGHHSDNAGQPRLHDKAPGENTRRHHSANTERPGRKGERKQSKGKREAERKRSKEPNVLRHAVGKPKET